MSKLAMVESDWEHLYTQFKHATEDRVLCLMHKQTKKFVYYDMKLNRLLTKQEALLYRPDVTGLHCVYR
ncbi:MAG: hypothetical protein A3K04_07085 [Gallionellales bacterium RBG_16_56_9]|nr:MAG: hypothetical protein A3K04_07085 [Gallionellales bacterium RBG_16_56_9]